MQEGPLVLHARLDGSPCCDEADEVLRVLALRHPQLYFATVSVKSGAPSQMEGFLQQCHTPCKGGLDSSGLSAMDMPSCWGRGATTDKAGCHGFMPSRLHTSKPMQP